MGKGKILLIVLLMPFIYAQASAEKMSNTMVHQQLKEGAKFYEAGDYLSAKATYDKAWVAAQDNLQLKKIVLSNLAAVYMKLDDYPEARELLEEVLRIDPHFEPAWLNLGFIYERESSEQEMKGHWIKALGFDVDKIIKEHKPDKPRVVHSVKELESFNPVICNK